MKKTILLLLTTLSLLSCDDGLIYDDVVFTPGEGRKIKFTGTIVGADTWAEGYALVIAGFSQDDYAIISKSVPLSDDEVEVVMTGIPDEVISLELTVVNRLRRRMVTFATCDETSYSGDTLLLEVGKVDVSMFETIQQQLFNTTCANCHGASAYAAKGLYLTEGKSFDAIVGVESKIVEGMKIVEPGAPEKSLLSLILSSDLSSTWTYDHSKEVLSFDTRTMLDKWIETIY